MGLDIILDKFETGNFSKWTGHTGPAGSIHEVQSVIKHAGTYASHFKGVCDFGYCYAWAYKNGISISMPITVIDAWIYFDSYTGSGGGTANLTGLVHLTIGGGSVGIGIGGEYCNDSKKYWTFFDGMGTHRHTENLEITTGVWHHVICILEWNSAGTHADITMTVDGVLAVRLINHDTARNRSQVVTAICGVDSGWGPTGNPQLGHTYIDDVHIYETYNLTTGDGGFLRNATTGDVFTFKNILEWKEGLSRRIPIKKIYSKSTPTHQAQFSTTEPKEYTLLCRLCKDQKTQLETLDDAHTSLNWRDRNDNLIDTVYITDLSFEDAHDENYKFPWLTRITLVRVQ